MTVSPDLNPAFFALGEERFASLTTFRKTGEGVSTPVWIARDGESLVVTTPLESGKVKRLRNSGRVELRACNRTGKVDVDAEAIAGDAEILDEPASIARLSSVLGNKYGFEFRFVLFVEKMLARHQKERVILRISAA
ncbi:MAG: hypothetical protein JWQ43_739 [Glaciihabitans sp.]|nr:hypothetical protein [Glaciihabitans sp.]